LREKWSDLVLVVVCGRCRCGLAHVETIHDPSEEQKSVPANYEMRDVLDITRKLNIMERVPKRSRGIDFLITTAMTLISARIDES